jgi:hypothetical protein
MAPLLLLPLLLLWSSRWLLAVRKHNRFRRKSEAETEGGEALLLDTKGQTDLPGRSTDAPLGQPSPAQGQWYALYTRSHCEQ